TIKYALNIHAAVPYGILNSFMISGIAGRSMVSEKKTVRRVQLSIARVNHARRLTIIPSLLSSIPLMLPFLVMIIYSLEQRRVVVVVVVALADLIKNFPYRPLLMCLWIFPSYASRRKFEIHFSITGATIQFLCA